MKAIIITEDSRTQLPEIKRWKNTRGQGEWIENNEVIVSRLNKSGYQLPGTNVLFEEKYKEILSDFIRPAEQMFAGSFLEVQTFVEASRRKNI